MNADELRALQAPLKARYRDDPRTAVFTVHAEASLADGIACRIPTARGDITAGLHPVAGGTGAQACSGDMLLEALVACAGVTLKAVATSMGITLDERSRIRAEGEIDSRGTLGIDKAVPVGFQRIRLAFDLVSDAPAEQLATLTRLTERYCVIYQTLQHPPAFELQHHTATP